MTLLRRALVGLGAVTTALLGLLAVAGPALVARELASPEVGSLADWVTASTTVAALLAAVYAGVQAGRVVRIERDRDEHRDRFEESEQARLVAAWGGAIITTAKHTVTLSGSGRGEPHTDVGPTVPARFQATIRNASRLPVFNAWVQVYIAHPDGVPAGGWQLVADHHLGIVLPESDQELDLVGASTVGGPDDWFGDPTNSVYEALGAEFAARGTRFDSPPELAVGWSFRDVAGTYWVHEPGGTLIKAPRPRPPST